MTRKEEKPEKRQEWNSFAGGHTVLRVVGATLVDALSRGDGVQWPVAESRPLMSA
jgi:hypothetical protein